MTTAGYAETILRHSKPLAPLPTKVQPKLKLLDGIRAVLFDVYGTLVISASGDIGATRGDHRAAALQSVCDQFRLTLNCPANTAIAVFEDEIHESHSRARQHGIEFPEIEIVEIWQAALPRVVEGDVQGVDFLNFALEYEVRVNPVWAMPAAAESLKWLAERKYVLGIVSNAQFFTPELFSPLLGNSALEFGFDPALSYFSYEHRQAKPGDYLFRLALRQLELQSIESDEALYVGNDMLNDVAAAASVGFRTALFAGDRRSLRLREDDERLLGVVPDVTITQLSQLTECLPT